MNHLKKRLFDETTLKDIIKQEPISPKAKRMRTGHDELYAYPSSGNKFQGFGLMSLNSDNQE